MRDDPSKLLALLRQFHDLIFGRLGIARGDGAGQPGQQALTGRPHAARPHADSVGA